MTPSRTAQQSPDLTMMSVPSWLASAWSRLKAEHFHGSIQINFTHGHEANANITWSISPDGTRR